MTFARTQSIHVPLAVAYLYLFFNVFLLPNGMFYTMLLAPLFLYHSLIRVVIKPYLLFVILVILFWVMQRGTVISYKDYLRSYLLIFLNITFLTNCYLYFRQAGSDELSMLFKKLTYFNFVMVGVAVVAFFIPPLKPLFWYMIPITEGSGVVARLKMLWSEASIYALVLSPLFLYFFLQGLFISKRIRFSFLLLLVLPLVLSNSMGVILGLLCALATTILFFRKSFLSTERLIQLLLITGILLLALGAWYWYDPNNVLMLRLNNILHGKDTSAKGRTVESFVLAGKFLQQCNGWWTGIGPGQFKLAGKELLLSYYHYSGNVADIRIPNACADTLIIYGIPGLVLRLGVQGFLFFYTRVYRNIYRFSVFVFLFLYQFSGSYFNNLLEWTIWVMVFSAGFDQFAAPKRRVAYA